MYFTSLTYIYSITISIPTQEAAKTIIQWHTFYTRDTTNDMTFQRKKIT